MLKLFKLTILLLLLGLFNTAHAQEYRDIAPQKSVEQNYLYDPAFHFPPDLVLQATVGDYLSPPVLVIDPRLRFKEYLWQTGDKREEITALPVISFKYESAGNYTLVVSARDQHGELHVATLPVTVKPNSREVKGESTIQSNSYKSVGSSITKTLNDLGSYPILVIATLTAAIITIRLLTSKQNPKVDFAQNAEERVRPLLAKRISS